MAPPGQITLILRMKEIPGYHHVISLSFPAHMSSWCYVQGPHLTIKECNVQPKVRSPPINVANFDKLYRLQPLYDWHILYIVGETLEYPFLMVVLLPNLINLNLG